MKFLIVGLGNPGEEYAFTRHNIGFLIADELVKQFNGNWSPGRFGDIAEIGIRGKKLTVLKPNTYMNLSGKAMRYWMQQLAIPATQTLTLVDDLAIDFGKVRIRPSGSAAGHNGLKNIEECLSSQAYPRLRFGIGSNFSKGKQIDYVLGKWNKDEEPELPFLIGHCVKACESFVLRGLTPTMNEFNK
ncbi:MAG: aminoacyl-tRNA hydrolase [Bacteroidia bacterium]|nr:aminoacyl-tRNA hydrolase [Bacteroidia bacterium]